MSAAVALVACDGYEEEKVYEAVKWGVDALGGLAAFVKPEEKVLLKPNLLGKQPPQMAVTTHPAVFGAVARLLREQGCADISYGDSPTTGTKTKSLDIPRNARFIKAFGVLQAFAEVDAFPRKRAKKR